MRAWANEHYVVAKLDRALSMKTYVCVIVAGDVNFPYKCCATLNIFHFHAVQFTTHTECMFEICKICIYFKPILYVKRVT
jgi:hypothetical protein